MLELTAGDAVALVSPDGGGRVAALTVADLPLLVTGDSSSHPMTWGCYPMVPYAGRVRNARFTHGGRTIELDENAPPNAIHGTGFVTPWTVLDHGLDHAELSCPLDWPLGGTAHQHLQLTPEALVCVLTVVAGHDSMPVSIGYHPWFVKPADDRLVFTAMYERGADGLPSGRLVEPKPRPWDDCFTGPIGPLMFTVAGPIRRPGALHGDGLRVAVGSDCDHWVVYDEPTHATCIEPQSGPPDAVNLGRAHVLLPGEMLQRTMTIGWQSASA